MRKNQADQGGQYVENFGCYVVALITMAAIAAAGTAARADQACRHQLGPDFPKTEMFIGNSFFYYNNGLPGHLSLMEKAADPKTRTLTATPW